MTLDKSPTVTASTRAFGVAGIGENILMHMRIKDLLHAQLVNKTWRTTIVHSLKLQQVLFFKPLPGEPLDWLLRPFNKGRAWKRKSSDLLEVIVLRNPFLSLLVDIYDSKAASSKFDAFNRPEASWRRMLVSQPPADAAAYLPSGCGRTKGLMFEHALVDRKDWGSVRIFGSEQWTDVECADEVRETYA